MSRFAENIQATNVVISHHTPKETQNATSLVLPINNRAPLQRSTSQSHCPQSKQQCNNNYSANEQKSDSLGSGPKRSSSGLLSIFKWFKKSSDKVELQRQNSFNSSSSSSSASTSASSSTACSTSSLSHHEENENTPTFPLSRTQSGASVDSLFSTATVASFTFVPPAVYNPYGNACVPEKLIAPGPETNTHKKRMKQLEKHRERDKNITLRKKYKLFSYESGKNKENRDSSSSSSSNSKRNKNNKKDIKPVPVQVTNRDYSELSLPLIKCHDKGMNNSNDDKSSSSAAPGVKSHRRTVSDSSKDRKAGAYVHVKGKRRAPPPPVVINSEDSVNKIQTTSNQQPSSLVSSPSASLSRRMKRQAPPPPESKADKKEQEKSPSSHLTQIQKDLLITNISKLQQSDQKFITEISVMTSQQQNGINSNSNLNSKLSDIPDVVCNDSLKLESGILKPVKEIPKSNEDTTKNEIKKQINPASPISPKPWYKRTLSSSSNRDSVSSSSHFKKEYYKHHSKSEDNDESFILKNSGNSKFSSVLSRFSITSFDERKKDENRKSGISMLANISELDREAALIVQQEQNKEQAKLDAKNESYYSPSNSQTDVPSFLMGQQQQQGKCATKKGSARELISKFNALTNATKISVVNSSFFSSSQKENSRRFSFQANDREISNEKSKFSPLGITVTPPMKRSIFKLEEFSEINEEEKNITPSVFENKPINNFEAKVVNTPPNLMKYFEPKSKIEKINNDKNLPNTPPLKKADEEDLKKKDGWTCTRCTLENGRMDVKCIACGMWKPFGKVTNIEKYLAPAPAQKEENAITKSPFAPVKMDKAEPTFLTSTTSTEYNDDNKKQMYTTETVLTETLFDNNENNHNLENETKMARTFAENVFKAFEMNDDDKKLDQIKPPNDSVTETAIVSSVTVIEPELSLEELRKARLARFSQHFDEKPESFEDLQTDDNKDELKQEKIKEISKIPPLKSEPNGQLPINSTSNKLLSEEQKKLRKMLKEMRDSLPKGNDAGLNTTKKVTSGKDTTIKEEVELKIIEDELPKKDLKTETSVEKNEVNNSKEIKNISKGAIPKIMKNTTKPIIVDEILKNKEDKVITAVVITKETTYENIKVKTENIENDKPIKVSAASQTPTTKITTKPPLARAENVMVPLTVEEMSTPKTTISRVGSFGKGNFELIKAKDFAGISSNAITPDSPLYANLPSTLEVTSIPAPHKELLSNDSSSQPSVSSSEEELLSAQLSDPEGIKDFKATLKQDKHNANTLAINRLLRRLETAIASGQHVQAARLAKDLARLKVNCSVTRQKKIDSPNAKYITADMYVEDQVTHQGPIPLRINPNMTIADLKQKVAQEFEIPSHVQRWILDKHLASDDDVTLEEFNINFDGCPMFLYLVAPDGEYEETLKRVSKRVRDGVKISPINFEQSDTDITEGDEEDEGGQDEKENDVAVPSTSKTEEVTNDHFDPSTSKDYDDIEEEEEEIPPNMWKCKVCTLLNHNSRPGCEACTSERPQEINNTQKKNYLQLVDLDNTDLVLNSETFECQICFSECQSGEGVVLRECLHSFCKQCLAQTIEYCEEPEIKCPYRDKVYSCDLALQEREIKALVTKEIYEQHLTLSVSQAENKIDNAFHCKTPDCRGWCIFEDNVNEFRCPVCNANNCLTCQVIHENLNCKEYQEQLQKNSVSNIEARRTRDLLDEMVSRGEAMICPTCQVVLMKKWGCDWLRCSMCKTEICWVTRGPRWGPGGKGDTSGGCKCGVNGIKCHPKCTYCH